MKEKIIRESIELVFNILTFVLFAVCIVKNYLTYAIIVLLLEIAFYLKRIANKLTRED